MMSREERDHRLEAHRCDRAAVIEWLRPATREDYETWLEGFIARGGQPSLCYSYAFPACEWFVAERHLALRPLYGAKQINAIALEGVAVGGDTGHSSIFYMDGFTTRSFHGMSATVPIYKDIVLPRRVP